MRFSAIRRMSALIERPGIISFAPGQPSPETFPVEAFQEVVREVIARDSATAFDVVKRYDVADSSTWAHPALAGNRLLVRDANSLTLWTIGG